MPLRAIINEEDVLTPLLSDVEWNNLKQRVRSEHLEVRTPCCGNIAYLRTSKHGLNHFAHKVRGNCTSESETWQHLKAKYEIVAACREAGYSASTEVEGNGWRADVLATKGNSRIAFEVQWSSQTWEITQQRQQSYKNNNVRGCWLFKTPPPNYRANKDVPLFKIEVLEEECNIIFNPQSYYDWQKDDHLKVPLRTFIVALLKGNLKFCDRITAKNEQDIDVKFISQPCWSCGAFYDIYKITNQFETNCGDSLVFHLSSEENSIYFAFHPEVQDAVRQYISVANLDLHLATFTKYYRKSRSKMTDAFKCPHCNALLGIKYLIDIYYSDKAYPLNHAIIKAHFKNPPTIFEDDDDFGALHGHWCYPQDQEFCCK